MTTKKASGYSGRGIRLRSAVMPVTAMNTSPVTVMGMFSSWAWAILLHAYHQLIVVHGQQSMNGQGKFDVRISQASDNSALVKCHSVRANGECRPDEGEQPQTKILEGVDDFAEFEVLLRGAGRVLWEAPLDECFFAVGEPRCCGGNCFHISNISIDKWDWEGRKLRRTVWE